MIPGIAAIQDVLEVLFESELGAKGNSRNFTSGYTFKASPYSFRLGSVFLASMDPENITLVFSGLSSIK